MKNINISVLLWLCSLLILASAASIKAEPIQEHQHGHSHGEDTNAGLVLNNGEKWKTDAPLRLGMQKIRDAVMHSVEGFHHDSLTQEAAEKVSKEINDQVIYLINNCDLEPEADATLHVLIGDLLNAAEKIKADPLSRDGMPKAVHTLNIYPNYFAHDGWKRITH